MTFACIFQLHCKNSNNINSPVYNVFLYSHRDSQLPIVALTIEPRS